MAPTIIMERPLDGHRLCLVARGSVGPGFDLGVELWVRVGPSKKAQTRCLVADVLDGKCRIRPYLNGVVEQHMDKIRELFPELERVAAVAAVNLS